MSDETYLNNILTKYQSDEMGVKVQVNAIMPILKKWGGKHFTEAIYTGSVVKGTAVSLCTDADVFISLSPATPARIGKIYATLHNAFTENGYMARMKNVSIGVSVEGYNIDFIPGKRISQEGYDHMLYKKMTNSRIKTNVKTFESYVTESNRSREIKLTKIWCKLNKLEFPSIHLEKAVIDCLSGLPDTDLNANFWKVLSFMAGKFKNKSYADPSNPINIISHDLTKDEKLAIQNAAKLAQSQPNWEYVLY